MVGGKQDPAKKDYFNKVSAGERAELLRVTAAISNLEIEITTPDHNSFKVKADKIKGSKAQLVSALVPEGTKPGSVVACFIVDLNKYLAKSVLQQVANGSWVLDLRDDIFLVQRRKNFRVDVPLKIIPRVEACLINQPKQTYEARILNISLGGCYLEMQAPVEIFQLDTKMKITLFIGEEDTALSLNSAVKRIAPVDGRDDKLFLGIEFDKLNSFDESRVNEVVMKCYRITKSFGSI